MVTRKSLLLSLAVLCIIPHFVLCDPSNFSEDCVKTNKECEEDTDCVHRLGYLQATCNTNTCQPQCRKAVLNLFQNRNGRNLLRTDTSCLTGRSELEKCNFLPNRKPLHCDLAKLVCDASLQCNAKWQVFFSECESEAAKGQCSDKCRTLLQATFATEQGAAFQSCTCTDKEDQLCEQLKGTTLRACSGEASPPVNTINHSPEMNETGPKKSDTSRPVVPVKPTPATTTPSAAGTVAVSLSLVVAAIFVW
ncbi:hypothetical protein L596_002304 [Steinernema carpocapsae]|uniref:GDNF/GAS1 domain-containing protein n=1 Tax=Steinernema carpocapsae TaxID=34508 RepID=A0A4V6I7P2_STECR|nr:hypothetical protein L596_002304 [Steinernema carpocapsae]